jgi:Fic family protein
MKRGASGTYEVATVGEERVRCFVPAPLPPRPPLQLHGRVQQLLESASLALGRLDSATALLPDQSLFLYSYVRKEAVLSSQIEGTQTSISDLLLFELDQGPGVPLEDVVEVSNYVAAVDHGVARLREGLPLSNRLIREVHRVLLSRGRGSGKDPGEFRRSQNWIGGSRPRNATYVPPPSSRVLECMGSLEQFLHADRAGLPVLLRAGLAHVQFETIHPFLDGNGRVGRLLIPLLLCEAGVLREPLLYLSLHMKRHRTYYFDLLQRVRLEGDWEAWLEFFLDGVAEVAEEGVATAELLTTTFAGDREDIAQSGRRAASAVRVHEALKARPILSLGATREITGLSFPTVSAAMDLLVQKGIARELTGRRRDRLFVYDRYLAIIGDEVIRGP